MDRHTPLIVALLLLCYCALLADAFPAHLPIMSQQVATSLNSLLSSAQPASAARQQQLRTSNSSTSHAAAQHQQQHHRRHTSQHQNSSERRRRLEAGINRNSRLWQVPQGDDAYLHSLGPAPYEEEEDDSTAQASLPTLQVMPTPLGDGTVMFTASE